MHEQLASGAYARVLRQLLNLLHERLSEREYDDLLHEVGRRVAQVGYEAFPGQDQWR